MSPSSSLACRPVWVWSLPAVAVIISFLWYRKKRVSLKTDTGGLGGSAQIPEQPKVDKESPVDKVLVNSVEIIPPEVSNSLEDVENEENFPIVYTEETCSPKGIIPVTVDEIVKAEADSPSKLLVDECALLKDIKKDVDSLSEKLEAVTSSVVEVSPETKISSSEIARVGAPHPSVLPEEDAAEFEEDSDTTIVEEDPVTTATQSEVPHKAEEPKTGDSSPKWVVKRKGKKIGNMDTEAGLGEQLSNLELKGTEAEAGGSGPKAPKTPKTPAPSTGERDSANTSPSEVMLASPSLSAYSDTNSEGSSDSGKGGSDVLTPSPTPVSGNSLSGDLPCDLPTICLYEFVIPQHLVGRLIGRNGSYIHEIKDNTHASVYIKRHPDTTKLKICAIEGTQIDIENALDMIRQKFPKKRYPNVTLERVELMPELPPVLPDYMQLYLVDAVNNDVIISSLVSAGHYFLQQPTHPTYPSLNRLNTCLNSCYTEPNLPALPDDCQPGVLCVAPVNDGWFRADVVGMDGGVCEVKFVDYGGYMSIEKSLLRQIRSDFVTLPFQASECFLAAVEPLGEGWCEEGRELVETLTLGRMLQAQIHGYTEHGVPLIFLYTVHNNQVVSVNEELVNHGFAEWLLPEPVTEIVAVEYLPVAAAPQPDLEAVSV